MYDLGGGVLLNKKGIIPVFVVILTILTILISVGYSALNQNLSVSGEAFLRAKDNIRISRIELSDAANDGYETYNPEYSKRTTKMYTTLPKDNSSVTYTVKVTNSTGLRYKVGSIDITSTNSNVSCTPSIEVNTILEDGITEFTVTANYENGMSQDTNLNACDIKYEFVPLDATPPTLSVQLVKDNGNTKTIKITAIDEVDGSGLSPDNIYKYYLSTSETELLGGVWKDYTNNTEFEISGDTEVRYLWIYPVKDRAGNISGGNSSVEPYSVGKYIFIDDVPTLYNVIAKEALTDGVAKLYTRKHNDAYDESGTKKVFHFYGENDEQATEVLSKNNVIFAGYCWQMIRTTDTGGTKLIYNGVPKESDGKSTCTNSGTEQQIGTSKFNPNHNSLAYVGYMYNAVYSSKTKNMTTREIMLYGPYSLSTNYWYADSISYDTSTGKYSLVNPYKVNSTSDYVSLKGKYTFNSSNETYTSSTVYYIGEISYSTYYGISLSDGNTIEYYDDAYTYGTSYTKNEDGTYTINEPSTIQKTTYYDNYTDLKGKYVCKNAVNNSCDTLWYIYSSSNTNFYWLNPENEYKYAKGFTYIDGRYVLDDKSVTIFDINISNEKTKLNNAHYTCFNTTGECETVFYVHYISEPTLYYIELKNGTSIEEALQEMLSADNVNQTNSTIKDTIDTWYANNMTNYTEYLEDTVFCNDRSISDYGGWNPDGGSISSSLRFKNKIYSQDNLYCTNITDRFSAGNEKAKLTYPVGLISAPEMHLLDNSNIRKTGQWYYLSSASGFYPADIRMISNNGSNNSNGGASAKLGVRPSVSLKSNTRYVKGTGSTTDPYIVDLNAPTVTQETIIDGEREKTMRITASDDYSLSSENKYKYYLSTSATTLSGGEWKDYTNGEIFTITGENETKYLWIYPVMDNAGYINGGNSDANTPYVLMFITFKDKTYVYDILQKEYATGSGLVKLYTGQHSDTYNETGTENIYYFYGADDVAATSVLSKNNVLFADFCWQMIRTTDTGGTKLIYNGVPKVVNGKSTCTNSGTEQQIGTSMFNNDSYGKPMLVGYMYGSNTTDFTINTNDSVIKTYIDNWYENNMTNYAKYLEDTVFCNDRYIVKRLRTEIYWTNYKENVTNLYCTNITDRFSISNSVAKLTYPVGMLSVPEFNILGNKNLRMTGTDYWTFSPYYYFEDSSSAFVNSVSISGNLSIGGIEESADIYGVRPSISLIASAEYVSGTGSSTDPYVLNSNPPTVSQEILLDGEHEKTVSITISSFSGLSSENQYKYYLSTSGTILEGGEWKDYIPGGKIILSGENETKYLWVYSVMDSAGNISGGKNSVNIPYMLSSIMFEDKPYLYNVLLKDYTNGSGFVKLYSGQHNDTYNEIGTENIYYYTASTSVLNKNNVLFAGFCWQMIRTTDTGGVKLIYNGIPKEVDGKKVCTNSGDEQAIGTSAFNVKKDSLAYAGYMYNTVYPFKSKNMSSSNIYKYARSFTYMNGTYKLSSDAISIDASDSLEQRDLDNAHYTCFNTTGECSTIYYIFHVYDSDVYYLELKSGKGIMEALNEMLSASNVNQTDSTLKTMIDTWYSANMTGYTNYLEDTVFCNLRNISDYAGWDPNGGMVMASSLYFQGGNYTSGDLYCTNVTDRFSVANDKAKLTYPVGLVSVSEMNLLDNYNLRKIGDNLSYWLMSPRDFFASYSISKSSLNVGAVAGDGYLFSSLVSDVTRVRPSVSLKPNTEYSSGTGSTTDPYVIKTS